jgi:hypothetical protein
VFYGGTEHHKSWCALHYLLRWEFNQATLEHTFNSSVHVRVDPFIHFFIAREPGPTHFIHIFALVCTLFFISSLHSDCFQFHFGMFYGILSLRSITGVSPIPCLSLCTAFCLSLVTMSPLANMMPWLRTVGTLEALLPQSSFLVLNDVIFFYVTLRTIV